MLTRKKNFMVKWIKKHWEVISYLIFGVLTTLLNILLYALFNRLFGYTAANSWHKGSNLQAFQHKLVYLMALIHH